MTTAKAGGFLSCIKNQKVRAEEFAKFHPGSTLNKQYYLQEKYLPVYIHKPYVYSGNLLKM